MSESIADDILRNGYERWQRLEGEKQAISDDLKELFAELKGQGFDGKALRAAFRTVAKIDDADVQEHNAVVDLYVESLTAPRVGTKYANAQARSAGDEITEPQPTKAAVRAVAAFEPVVTSSVENGAAKISTPNTEPQSRPTAGSDLTTPPSLNGQVAPLSPETANEAPMEVYGASVEGATAPLSESGDILPGGIAAEVIDGSLQPPAVPIQPETASEKLEPLETIHADPLGSGAATRKDAEPEAPAPTYAAPGVVTHEHTPPEGIIAHPYAACWPVRNIDVADGIREPIVKIGKMILDGRGRYFAARAARTLDGMSLEYPTVQYNGADPLMDCIRWNMASRPDLHPHNLKMIAQKLVKEAPDRAEEIFAAMGIAQEVAA